MYLEMWMSKFKLIHLISLHINHVVFFSIQISDHDAIVKLKILFEGIFLAEHQIAVGEHFVCWSCIKSNQEWGLLKLCLLISLLRMFMFLQIY